MYFGEMMIPFQLHRRLPLIRRPFYQRDRIREERDSLAQQLTNLQSELTRLQNVADERDALAEQVDSLRLELSFLSSDLNVIVVRLQGGLGNQLFRYAFARFVALKQCAALWIDKSFYPAPRGGYAAENPNRMIEFEMSAFRIFCQRIVSDVPRSISLTQVRDYGQRPCEVAAIGKNLLLEGDWTSQFDHLLDAEFSDLLRYELQPRARLENPEFLHNRELIEKAPNSVAVHVRRGDYTLAQDIFTLLGQDYYDRALALMESRVGASQIFVFSDEIELVRDTLCFPEGARFVATRTIIENFELSKACKHIIAANSSYSWWVAYLKNKDGFVVIPKNWHSSPELRAKYENSPMLPPDWARI
jgi:hypothetical protein